MPDSVLSPLPDGSLRPAFAAAVVFPVALVLGVAVLVVAATSAYGLHRDEYLYLALGRHLDLWKMDWPPGIALLAELGRALFGTSKVAVRVLPALAGAATVVLSAAIAREMGGTRRAQTLAAVATASFPLVLGASALFQPVVFDQLWWTLAFFAFVRVLRRGALADWALLGVAAGLGVLTKFTFGVLGVSLAAALVLSRQRSAFRTPGPYLALALALVLASPALVGQIRLEFPVLLQMAALRAQQLDRVTPAAFLAGQVVLGPAVALAALGAVALLAHPRLRPFRAVGVAACVAFGLLLAMKGKPYYAGPIYPTLLAAGACVLAAIPGTRGSLVSGGVAVAVVAFALVALPFVWPILPPPTMARYAARVGPASATTSNVGARLALPQDYADMLGWEAQTDAIARIYRALPPSDRARTVLLAGNYGEAGALDYFGPRLGLPPARHPSGSYWHFGPGPLPGEVVLAIGIHPDSLRPAFADVRLVDTVHEPWGVPEEQHVPVVLARGPHVPLPDLWPRFKGRY